MTCTKNCTHQPCPAPMACGVGGTYPVIDESLLRRPLEARSQPDDMTYSGAFNGADIPLYQDNSDGSDPGFQWLDDLVGSMLMRTFLILGGRAVLTILAMLAGYFCARAGF